MFAAILGAIKSVFDFLGTIFGQIFKVSNAKKKKKDIAQSKMDKAVKDEDPDAFLDGLNDKRGA